MFLSVIIPAFNEQRRLPETLTKVGDYLARQNYDWEVLIVNDGSKDETAAVVSNLIGRWNDGLGTSRSLSATHSSPVSNSPSAIRDAGTSLGDIPSAVQGHFRLIDNQENKGKGAVVKQGMLEAQGEWRLFMDADNSTDISELPKLWKFANPKHEALSTKQIQNSNELNSKRLENSNLKNSDLFRISNFEFRIYDIIIGSRYLKADSIKIKQPFARRMVSRIGNWLIRILLGLDIVDTQCGFKLFSAKAAQDIFSKQTIERWGFDMEILAIARKRGYKIKEVAVDWYDSTGSTVRKSAALKTLKELMIIKWNLMRGKYNSIDRTG